MAFLVLLKPALTSEVSFKLADSRGIQYLDSTWRRLRVFPPSLLQAQSAVNAITRTVSQPGQNRSRLPSEQLTFPHLPSADRDTDSSIMKSILPPKYRTIQRSEWPQDSSNNKSLAMSLHQVGARSPRQVLRKLETGDDTVPERYYAAV